MAVDEAARPASRAVSRRAPRRRRNGRRGRLPGPDRTGSSPRPESRAADACSPLPRQAEHAGRVEALAKHARIAAPVAHRPCFRRRVASTSLSKSKPDCVADIERRMRVEDLQARQQQEEQRDRPDPMRDPRPQALTIDERPPVHVVVRHFGHCHSFPSASCKSVRIRSGDCFTIPTTQLRDWPACGFLPTVSNKAVRASEERECA